MNQQTDHAKSLDAELFQTRLLSFVNAISGFVHNISNPLTLITTRVQLLNLKMPQNSEFEKMANQSKIIVSMLNNLAYISQNIVSTEIKSLNINELLKNELTFFRTDTFFNHEVKKNYQFYPNLSKTKGFYFHVSTLFFCIMHLQLFLMRDTAEKTISVKTSEKDNNILIDISGTGGMLSDKEVNQICLKSINLETEDIKPRQLLINNLIKSHQIIPGNYILTIKSDHDQTYYQIAIPIIHE
ncbi:MAG TPA: hypothetical protein DHW42_00290 [Candidatus Marinimicrobia bacterium]|nr:hypothetical protein [Candidatus Neomarinimicrobiota bacterium]